LVILILIVLFAENFVFSQHLGLLKFREVDDLGFQYILRRIHEAISSGRLHLLGARNDAGYGWIFWIPMALVTYPFYLLSHFFGVDWPLIVLPRQLSLLFGALTLIIVRRTLLAYGASKLMATGAMALLALTPPFGYFCMRFGTVHQGVFLSAWTVFLIVRKSQLSQRDLNWIAVAFGAAAAYNLTGFFFWPIVA
jgi:hypothetical protein